MTRSSTSCLLPIITHDFTTAKDFLIDLFETQFVIELLVNYRGDIPAAARRAALSEAEIIWRIEKQGIDAEEFEFEKRVQLH